MAKMNLYQNQICKNESKCSPLPSLVYNCSFLTCSSIDIYELETRLVLIMVLNYIFFIELEGMKQGAES